MPVASCALPPANLRAVPVRGPVAHDEPRGFEVLSPGRRTFPLAGAALAVPLVLVIGVAAAVGLRQFRPTPTSAGAATAPPTATPAGTLTTTPSPPGSTATPRRPQGYVLPIECRYIDSGTVDGSATTWKVSCPQGLPSNFLRPSLSAQGWISCASKAWQKEALQIAITDAVNVSGFSGWLDQRPLAGSGCIQPTPPPNTP